MDHETRLKHCRGFIHYFSRLSKEQPNVDEWREGYELSKRWYEFLTQTSPDLSVIEPFAEEVEQLAAQGGSGAIDLDMHVRGWLRELKAANL